VRSTGAGNGTLPAAWGPDADGPDHDEDDWEPRRSGGRWLRLAAVLAALIALVVVLVVAFNLGRGSSDQPRTTPGSQAPSASQQAPQPVDIAGISDFDPEASPPQENPEMAPLAIDGNPDTAWETMTYRGRPDLGGLKSGVGLRLDLGKVTSVSQVRVTLVGSPTSLQILAAPKGAGEPTSTAGLRKVAAKDGAGTKVDLTLDKPVETRYLVVWLTSLPPASGGYKGQVAEVEVLS
jgi:hypothetical protein